MRMEILYTVLQGIKTGGSHRMEVSVDIRILTQGKVKLLLSLSPWTLSLICPVPIDANGNAIIDQNSEIAKTFFKTVDTRMATKFIGKLPKWATLKVWN